MTFRDRSFAVWGLPLVVLFLALIGLGADLFGIASGLRGFLFDSYVRAAPRPYRDTAASGHRVLVLDIDAGARAKFGDWPWPHAVTAGMIEAIKRQGAAAVVVADRFDKPDPASARSLLALVPPGPSFDATRTALTAMPSADTALAGALAGIKSVTGLTLSSQEGEMPAVLKNTVLFRGSRNPFDGLPLYGRVEASLDTIAAASGGLGVLNLTPDRDGVVRRMTLVFRAKDNAQVKQVLSLDGEMLRQLENKDTLAIQSDEGQGGILGGLLSGQAGAAALLTENGPVVTSPDASVWIAWSGANAKRMITASALIEGNVPLEALRDAVVYIGAPGDLVATPLGPRPIAEVHAETAENLLLGTVLRRPARAEQGELLCLMLFSIGCWLILVRFGVAWAAAFVAAVVGAGFYIGWHLYAVSGVLLDVMTFNTGLLLVWLTGALGRSAEILATRAKLKRAFTDVLPPRVIGQIARRPEKMKLDGESRTVTYLACGVRGFSELASSFRGDPAAFTRLIQRVLDPLMEEALHHGGAIGKLTADGFTAFWNAPLDDSEHAVHACEAAMGMMEAIAHTNEIITHERRIDGVALSPVEIGVGLSTGPAIAGGFKVHGRTAYSVNGDCAVRAERIQALSAQYGPAVIVGEDTRKAAERGFAFLEVDYIALESHDDPTKLYAMLGNPVMRASPKFRALATFHDHIFQSMRDQQWHKAKELIAQCRKLSGASQKLYDLHLSRIAYFESHAPGAEWDGAFRPILQ